MINPVQLSTIKDDGSARKIIIEPVLKKTDGEQLSAIGTYKIYKDDFGDETSLFTEPRETDETNSDLADEKNPDYLGKLSFQSSTDWNYTGDLLSAEEQNQVALYILELKDED